MYGDGVAVEQGGLVEALADGGLGGFGEVGVGGGDDFDIDHLAGGVELDAEEDRALDSLGAGGWGIERGDVLDEFSFHRLFVELYAGDIGGGASVDVEELGRIGNEGKIEDFPAIDGEGVFAGVELGESIFAIGRGVGFGSDFPALEEPDFGVGGIEDGAAEGRGLSEQDEGEYHEITKHARTNCLARAGKTGEKL